MIHECLACKHLDVHNALPAFFLQPPLCAAVTRLLLKDKHGNPDLRDLHARWHMCQIPQPGLLPLCLQRLAAPQTHTMCLPYPAAPAPAPALARTMRSSHPCTPTLAQVHTAMLHRQRAHDREDGCRDVRQHGVQRLGRRRRHGVAIARSHLQCCFFLNGVSRVLLADCFVEGAGCALCVDGCACCEGVLMLRSPTYLPPTSKLKTCRPLIAGRAPFLTRAHMVQLFLITPIHH